MAQTLAIFSGMCMLWHVLMKSEWHALMNSEWCLAGSPTVCTTPLCVNTVLELQQLDINNVWYTTNSFKVSVLFCCMDGQLSVLGLKQFSLFDFVMFP